MIGTSGARENKNFPLRHDNIIRSEIFSAERLEQHAESLALSHTILANSPRRRLLESRLRENGKILRSVYTQIGKAIGESSELPPAAEWLVDNYFIIEEQIRDIRNDLPPTYYLQLPKLAAGYLTGYPRVYGLAWAYIAHTDSFFSPDLLRRFIRAYQHKQPLQIGELWAVAITLRIALVENLRRAATLIIEDRQARVQADALAETLMKFVDGQTKTLDQELKRIDLAKLSSAFSVQLIYRLRDQGARVLPLLERLDARLQHQGISAEEIVRTEHQNQGALTVTVRNIITSMRLISTFDWVEFFESVSLVDEKLRASSQFGAMDLPTRNLYRHAIERLAQRTSLSEIDVTEKALEIAARANTSGNGDPSEIGATDLAREQEPGYYLIDNGVFELERAIGYRPTWRDTVRQSNTATGFIGYILANVALVTCIIELGLSGTVIHRVSFGVLLALSSAVFFPAWEAAITLINRLVTSLFNPNILPGMALRAGVPENLRTMVVVPTFLSNENDIKAQVEQLEVHYLSNADGDLAFAILSDWKDADTQTLETDQRLLEIARIAIDELNLRHGLDDDHPRFYLFHRRRVWNPREGKWMGWERKRGKLHEFNLLLRGSESTTFVNQGGPDFQKPPSRVRYVITLDSDTRLPRGAVKRLIGKMAHPLNRARIDPQSGTVTEGYGILQPRVASSLPQEETNSFFQRIFYSASGIDPYAFAISDVYQDLFDEGSFTGKGIYDVDIFEKTVTGRVPENAVLSHDLLEGIFARAGLASDVEVVEEFPSRYDVASSRQHRWARGDWQLLPWIFGKHSEGIPALGHWKMIDNLRRTLTSPAAFTALLIGWTFPLGAATLWTALIVVTLSMSLLLNLFEQLWPRRGAAKSTHWLAIGKDTIRTIQQVTLMVTFLPHQAWLMMDAVMRTIWRLAISHNNMLEWVTAAEVKVSEQRDIRGFYAYMSGSLVLTGLATGALLLANSTMWPVAAPFLLLWALAPAVAQIASRPGLGLRRTSLNEEETKRYRHIGRSTWRFFDRFVTAEENWLPPDNFQEEPSPVVAHRTSPTNIGLYFLSVIAAHDFGWIGAYGYLERMSKTFATLEKLERFNGHFYNWYDTQTLRPLLPRYISSVDSGNLAGYLIVLAQASRSIGQERIVNAQWLDALSDVIALLDECLSKTTGTANDAIRRQLNEAVLAMSALIDRARAGTPSLKIVHSSLVQMEGLAATIEDLAATFHTERGKHADAYDTDVLNWGSDLRNAVAGYLADLRRYAPWLDLLTSSNAQGLSAVGVVEALTEQEIPSLESVIARSAATEKTIEALVQSPAEISHAYALRALLAAVRRGAEFAKSDCEKAGQLSAKAMLLFHEMDFSFLLDPARKLMSIGFRVDDNSLDTGFYDLLASEARLASIVAIAKGDIPAHNWFRLGRTVTSINYRPALVSWSGSMFEYLMPALVMREPDESLLGQTNRMVVKRQIDYGKERGVPWGVSESAYNARDFEFTYQYSSFGVPGLGLKRGLSDNIVIAPYATALAAMIDPQASLKNLDQMEKMGGRGLYGWYEAFDFTGKRLPEARNMAVVHAYMAHHQGMSLVAILNVVHNGRMRERFHSEPIIQATELLLQELPPRNVAIARPRSEEVAAVAHIREIAPPNPRCFSTPHSSTPRSHMLSNGEYAVMMTTAGSGYSLWKKLSVTRWREDPTRDAWGSYIYMRDAQNGKLWSAAFQPVCAEAGAYNVSFFEDHAEFSRRDGDLATTMNVVVSSEDQGEVRRLTIHNHGAETRDLELTSYSEIVLAPADSDMAHPAFSKLFVQTEFVQESGALIATRRLRSSEETPLWAVHLVSVGGEMVGSLQYETDRARFIGRGRTLRNPQAVDGRPLNDTVGTVLDPIFSLRCRVRVTAGATVHVAFWTLIANSREQALDFADKYHATSAYNRAAARAWTQAQLQYQHLGMTPEEAHLFQRLANHIIYSDRSLRPNSDSLRKGAGPQSVLWSLGVSGDLPIVVMRVDVASDMKTLKQMVRAYNYWSFKRLEVDLVILNEQPTTYLEDLQNEIELLVRTSQAMPGVAAEEMKGRIFVFRGDHVSAHARDLLLSTARAVIVGHRGSLAEQLAFQSRSELVNIVPRQRRWIPKSPAAPFARPPLEFFNGIGGFDKDGSEYVTILEPGQVTPAPWINVIANAQFGFQVSSEGAGYTWAVNSREYKLTPWSNDPVSDEASEIIYLRDTETGAIWSPTATPIRRDGVTYVARHGFGFSRFQTTCFDIESDLTQFVPVKDSIKVSRLKLKNVSKFVRQLSVSSFTEWALGASRSSAAPFFIVDMDSFTGSMHAVNPWNNEFGTRVAFVHMSGKGIGWTSDRREFLGRNGSLQNPAALASGQMLSRRSGAGLDPCSVLQQLVQLDPGEETEIIILLGDSPSAAQARTLLKTYQQADLDEELHAVCQYWDTMLRQIQVRSPDRAMDIMQNGWLLYQTVACRILARSAFYQTSGAYGYRDQLQDMMAMAINEPSLARQHLLRAAGRQFPEGDVQHWWLPSKDDAGRGVRTRFSDDPLWLAFVTAYYVRVTGDRSVLDEEVPFLAGSILRDDQHESFFLPERSSHSASLYEHCVLAIDCRLTTGAHGLSLFGGGDWNDGMNRVGAGGKGESTWLSWFLLTVIRDFSHLLNARDDTRRTSWQTHTDALKNALAGEGWDGEWYRRGYYDDGTPLGSASSAECRIDSIAQSWSVISGGGDPEHQKRAMKAVEQYLIKHDDGVALLFTPPFDQTNLDPGYIKGYPPGIRENGGQYTHAALWSVAALNIAGNGDKGFELFSMLNPINHSSSRASSYRYKVEPYVVAADIYSNPQHLGRGGWTWYTGSSSWMYRTSLESILGFNLQGTSLSIDPCIPRNWPGFTINYHYKTSRYSIIVENPDGSNRGVAAIVVDGQKVLEKTNSFSLLDDGREHTVTIRLGQQSLP